MVTARMPNTRRMAFAGGARSSGSGSARPPIQPARQATTKATPQARQSAPGTMNAARQPKTAERPPATSAAAAIPAEPKTPFTPSARPRCGAWEISQGIPTGW